MFGQEIFLLIYLILNRSVVYWLSFSLMWFILPFVSGVYDNGEFTTRGRLKASLKFNAILFGVAGAIAAIVVIVLTAKNVMTLENIMVIFFLAFFTCPFYFSIGISYVCI